MAVSIELEREQETWRTERREEEQRKQEGSCSDQEHIIEVEAQRQKARRRSWSGQTQAEALRQRWAEQEARVAEHKAAVKASRGLVRSLRPQNENTLRARKKGKRSCDGSS